MKTLYRDDYRPSCSALDLCQVTREVLKPIFDDYLSEGYSPREISQLMQSEITILELEAVLE